MQVLLKENQELKKQLQIKHDGFMDSTDELCEFAKENQKLEQALDEIEKYIENHKRESKLHIYGLAIPKFVFDGDIDDIEEIIQKAKGDDK